MAAITGASSGIGQEFARRLAADHDLLLIARNRDRLEALAGELRTAAGSVEVLAADLTDTADLKAAAARIAAEPALELLINNAGFGQRGAVWNANVDLLDQMHRLHVLAPIRLTHAALGVMVPKNRGGIINVASVAAFAARAGSAGYGASKSWLTAFSEGLLLDLKAARSSVRIQALCPGFTYSGFHDLMQEDRRQLAPASWWLTAEAVVDASLKALPQGTLFVVPGWRYRLIVAVLGKLPLWIKLKVEATRGSGNAQ